MKLKRGSTSVRRLIFIADSTSTTGAGLTGLVYNSAGLAAYYFAGDLADEVVITLATATLGTWTSGGFVQVDATNMPGWYEVGIPNAALDGGTEVAIQFRGATNMVPVNIYVELDTVDYQTAVFGGATPTNVSDVQTAVLAKLPAALVGGRIDASVGAMEANTITASSIAADAITDAKVASDVTIASVTGAVGSVTGNVGGNVTGSVGSVVGLTASNLDAAVSTLATAANLATVAGYLDTEIAAIKAKTDNLPSDPADASDIAASFVTVNSKLDTIDDFLDTEVAAIKAKTDQFVFTVANQVDANALSATGGDASQTTLLAVKAKTDLITSQSATVQATPIRTLSIVRGDSYSGATALTVAVTTNYTGYTPTFTIRHRVTDAVLCTVTPVVTSSTVLTITLTTTNTAFADLLSDDEFGPHPWDIQLVSGAVSKTESGIALVYKDQTRA